MNGGSCRVRGQKSKFLYRHAELGEVKVKIPGTLRPADCSRLLCSQESAGEKLGSLFVFFTATLLKVVSVTLRSFLHRSRIWRRSQEVK